MAFLGPVVHPLFHLWAGGLVVSLFQVMVVLGVDGYWFGIVEGLDKQCLAKWPILPHRKHFFSAAGHDNFPPSWGKEPPQFRHFRLGIFPRSVSLFT